MFSASLPPTIIATVLGGLDVMEREPERLKQLWENVAYTSAGLKRLGFAIKSETPVFPLVVPVGMNLRRTARQFHEAGIFVNSVEYPAVPISQQRFRVSLMASHTRQDIDRLLEVVAAIWSSQTAQASVDFSLRRSEAA